MSSKKPERIQTLLAYLPDILDGIEPSWLADFLKDANNFSSNMLNGFRINARTVTNPVIRQRLIHEAEKDLEFFEFLCTLWVDCNKDTWFAIFLNPVSKVQQSLEELITLYGPAAVRIALLLDDRKSINRLVPKVASVSVHPKPKAEEAPPIEQPEPAACEIEQLRKEIHRLKDRIREAEGQVKKTHRLVQQREGELNSVRTHIKALKQELAERNRELEKTRKMLDRATRAKQTAEERCARTEQELKEARKRDRVIVYTQPRRYEAPSVRGPDWFPTISTMLKNGHYDAARIFCETLKETEPDSLHAHLALEHVYGKIGGYDHQLEECLWIAEYLSNRNNPTRACAFVCRALEIRPTSKEAQELFCRIIREIKLNDESTAAVRSMLGKLKASKAKSYKIASTLIEKLGKEYVRVLEPQPAILHADKILDFTDGTKSIQLSIRRIATAVDTNDITVVEFLRCALARLKATKPTLWQKVIKSLDAYDSSCLAAIISGNQPVVVDGSNVAWYESDEKPRLGNILEVRSELRSGGYFPIYIYVDASLPYQVDKQAELQRLIEEGAVVAVESHTDADQTILERAKRLHCPIVTNDRMAEYDPEGQVPKFRFAIDRFGASIYDRWTG